MFSIFYTASTHWRSGESKPFTAKTGLTLQILQWALDRFRDKVDIGPNAGVAEGPYSPFFHLS